MSKRMSRNDVRSFARAVGKPLFYTGYANLQHLTKYAKELGYNYGIYGWNWTAYSFPDFVLVTGYRNLCGTEMKEAEKFDKEASEIIHEYYDTFGSKPSLTGLLDEVTHELFLAQKED